MTVDDQRGGNATPGDGPDGPSRPSNLRLAAGTHELARMRGWLVDQLEDRVTDEQRQLILLAATELATNAIEAHQRRLVDQPIDISFDCDATLLIVEDRSGGGFDAKAVEPRTVDTTALRGRGLMIVRSICPDVRFVETDVGLRVEFPISPAALA